MSKSVSINSLFLLIFFLLPLSLTAQDSPEETIFSPVAEEFKQYPQSTLIYNQYIESGNHYLSQKLYSEAKNLFWKAIHLYPQRPDAYVNLGIAHMYQNDLESALRMLKEAEELSGPEYNQAEILYYNLGRCFFLREEYPRAVTYFEKAVREFAGFAQGRYELARSYLGLGQNEKAYVNIFIAAYIYEQQEDQKKTSELRQFLTDIEATRDMDKRFLGNVFFEYGLLALKNQQLDKAIVLFEESALLNPDSTDAYYQLALIYTQRRAFHNAINYWNKIIEVNPAFIEAYLGLYQAHREVENHELAVGILELVSTIDKQNPAIQYHMALVCIEQGQLEDAKKYLDQAEFGALKSKNTVLLGRVRTSLELLEEQKTAKTKLKIKDKKPLYPYRQDSGNKGKFVQGVFEPSSAPPKEY